MPRLIWSPSALADVQRLYRFLAQNNTDAARRAVKSIREGVKILALRPGIGRPAEDIEPEYRDKPRKAEHKSKLPANSERAVMTAPSIATHSIWR